MAMSQLFGMGIVSRRRIAKVGRAVGLLGGTFDPPHCGHLHLAKQARRDLPIRKVELIPNGQPPHRQQPQLPWAKRVALCRALVSNVSGVEVGEDEPPGMTRWTIALVTRRAQKHRIILIMGADAFSQFTQWRDWRRILCYANIAVAGRAGVRKRMPSVMHRHCRLVRRAADLVSGGRKNNVISGDNLNRNGGSINKRHGRIFFWRCHPPDISSTMLRAKS